MAKHKGINITEGKPLLNSLLQAIYYHDGPRVLDSDALLFVYDIMSRTRAENPPDNCNNSPVLTDEIVADEKIREKFLLTMEHEYLERIKSSERPLASILGALAYKAVSDRDPSVFEAIAEAIRKENDPPRSPLHFELAKLKSDVEAGRRPEFQTLDEVLNALSPEVRKSTRAPEKTVRRAALAMKLIGTKNTTRLPKFTGTKAEIRQAYRDILTGKRKLEDFGVSLQDIGLTKEAYGKGLRAAAKIYGSEFCGGYTSSKSVKRK